MIRLEFTALDVEVGGFKCVFDSVKVFDGEEMFHYVYEDYDEIWSEDPVAKLCGSSIPPPITSSHSSMIVRFTSDESVTATGFSVKYTTLAGKCSHQVKLYMFG